MTRSYVNKSHTRRRAGFTLAETLVVVAVLIVLFAVGMLSLPALRKNLRQRELDSKAEIIYMAAQNRIAELRASGYSSVYEYRKDADNGVKQLGLTPCDAQLDADDDDPGFCYVDSSDRSGDGMAAALLLPASAVDGEVWGNQWRIEYDPVSGNIYSVFYSESNAIPDAPLSADALRIRKARLNGGAVVGYYGGDLAQVDVTDALQPAIDIENTEKLTAAFSCVVPAGDATSRLTFEITLSDGTNSYTRTVSSDSLIRINSRTYRYTWVLDSLDKDATRFYAQTEGKLTCGTPLSVKLTVKSSNPLIDQASVDKMTNGLFGYREGAAADTALLSYGRHLQNLDEASHVSPTVTKAIQTSDISFTDNASNDRDWYSLYGDTFQPIRTTALTSYDGHDTVGETEIYSAIYGLHIPNPQRGAAGLFQKLSGNVALSNMTLTGVRIDGGTDVGALAGQVDGTLTTENCRVFLSAKKGDLTGLTAADTAADVTPWLQGDTVGGLIGRTSAASRVTLDTSLAATAILAQQNAGGLIGMAGGTVAIRASYADCYLRADVTGGLIGGAAQGASVSLSDFYAAGYQTAASTAAGLIPGALAWVQNGYSACAYPNAAGISVYSTAVSCSGTVDQVYYLSSAAGGASHLNRTQGKTYEQLTDPAILPALGSGFTLSSGSATFPYNLLNQGLTYYSYPRLQTLNHYGDWQADFEAGSLVYYEVYDGDNGPEYAFSGANADTLAANRVAVGDGYALAYLDQPDPNEDITLEYGDGETLTFRPGTNVYPVTYNGQDYYLVPLPVEVVNTDYIDPTGPDSFYQSITINGDSYYYNPHFAQTVTVNETKPSAPDIVSVRSARHLYNMSLYYADYAAATSSSTFRQGLDLDYTAYDWTAYAGCPTVSVQRPIDSVSGFVADYDGVYHTVRGISVRSDGTQIGLFASIAQNAYVRNVVLTGRVGQETVSYYKNGSSSASGSRTSASIGALTGVNYGSIRNCAVSGYQTAYYGYRSNVSAIGGLIGTNYGAVRSCSADAAGIQLVNTNASSYIGGFVGRNHGSVTASYALGKITVLDARNSTVWIAGFAADNAGGAIRRCYAATALTASGSAESYGFAHTGGTVSTDCRYLDGGTYSYAGALYAYNTSTNEYAQAGQAAGRPITGSELAKLRLTGFTGADYSYEHDLTGGAASEYPYPAVVTDSARHTVHYGNWPIQQDIGTLGVFYWEKESGGSNSGYHFSYVGTSRGAEISSNGNDLLQGKSLCQEHNDGGVVTAYGYGYFYKSNEQKPSLSTTNCNLGKENTEAGAALGRQMAGYTFVAYQTGEGTDYTYLTSSARNSTWRLQYTSGTRVQAYYQYSVSPFFADAISLDSIYYSGTASVSTGDPQPGTEDNPYQVRSTAQLQFINWNYGKLTASYSISSGTWQDSAGSWWSPTYYRTQYAYLLYSEKNNVNRQQLPLYWQQSHDMDSWLENGEQQLLFTPIGSLYDTNASLDSASSDPYTAFFASNYDGQAYAIKNVEIQSTGQCIGLFGITAGAKLSNIILYSDRGNTVTNLPGGSNWYCVGGLVGFAASREAKSTGTGGTGGTSAAGTSASFTNCTVSGYTIKDTRGKGEWDANDSHTPGWGGGIVGGLVGMTNMDITRCTAVTDIVIDMGYNIDWMNVRVGGIAGVCRATVSSCYAGGSIVSNLTAWDGGYGSSTNIWIGGIVGGVVARNTGSIGDLLGDVNKQLTVVNCYSYVQMPAANRNHIRASMAIASNGEMLDAFDTTPVYTPNIIIRNSYALQNTAANASDYLKYGRNTGWNTTRGTNINPLDSSTAARAVTIYNRTSPYLTYDQMKDLTTADGLLQKLGADSGFGIVTTTENGAVIDGKYSFPGDDTALLGLNYPFPTILTQTDVFGQTVNVHYGAWPKFSLYWETTSTALDLLSDISGTDPTAKCTLKLYAANGSRWTQPAFTFYDDEGNELDDASVRIDSAVYNQQDGCYDVTIVGRHTGETVVRAALNGYTADVTVTVTAALQLQVDPTNFSLYEGETQTLTISVSDARGTRFTSAMAAQLQWTLLVDNGDSETAVIECSASDITYDPAAGTFTVPLSAFSAGEATVTVACRYPYAQEDGATAYAQQTVSLMATVHASDVVGLSGGTADARIRIPHTPEAGTTEYTGTLFSTAEELPLRLYASHGYTDPAAFTLKRMAVACGGVTYEADAADRIAAKGFTLTLLDWAEDGDCMVRAIEVQSDASLQLTLSMELTYNGVAYKLELPYTYTAPTPEIPDAGNTDSGTDDTGVADSAADAVAGGTPQS